MGQLFGFWYQVHFISHLLNIHTQLSSGARCLLCVPEVKAQEGLRRLTRALAVAYTLSTKIPCTMCTSPYRI